MLALGWAVQLHAQDDSPQLRRIIDAYQRTYSGANAGDRLSSVIIKGTQTQGEVEYDFVLRKKEPNSIRFRLSNDSASVICGYNGAMAWKRIERNGKVQIDELSDGELRNLQREANFQGPLLGYSQGRDGHQIQLMGTSVVSGRTAYKIQVKEPGSLVAVYYLGTDDHYLLRRELLDEGGTVALTSDYRDYRVVNGFPFSFNVVNTLGDEQLSVTAIDSVSVNPGQLNFYFEKPTY